jgi:hypothetical protein
MTKIKKSRRNNPVGCLCFSFLLNSRQVEKQLTVTEHDPSAPNSRWQWLRNQQRSLRMGRMIRGQTGVLSGGQWLQHLLRLRNRSISGFGQQQRNQLHYTASGTSIHLQNKRWKSGLRQGWKSCILVEAKNLRDTKPNAREAEWLSATI